METSGKQFRKRNAILSCLRQTQQHPSAEVLHRMLQQEHPDISLATVYRNLTLFKSQGLIQSLGTVDGVERFDGVAEPHVHFVCRVCGAVQDLPKWQAPGDLCQRAEAGAGGHVEGFRLMFTGVCRSCQAALPEIKSSIPQSEIM